jgi:hypothetical protein
MSQIQVLTRIVAATFSVVKLSLALWYKILGVFCVLAPVATRLKLDILSGVVFEVLLVLTKGLRDLASGASSVV